MVSDHNDGNITVEVDDYVAAVYDCKAYVGKVLEVDELDVHISFFAHKGDLSISTTFVIPKVPDEVWVAKENILCIIIKLKLFDKCDKNFCFSEIILLRLLIK